MRTALIGGGYRGRTLLRLMEAIPFYEPVAVADPGAEAEDFPSLAVYSRGPEDYLRMLREEKPELAVICSPWDCHIPQAVGCLKAGCHVALEIRGGAREGEYAPLADFPGRVFPLENIIFRRDILAVREMVRAGLFGELVRMQGGYRHDLRAAMTDADGVFGGSAEWHDGKSHEVWRAGAYTRLNGDIYPTHSIAPLCFIGGIRSLGRVTAFASKSAGLKERFGDACPPVTMGDIVNTVAVTPDGILLSITHDTTLPRPRGFGLEVQGTKGIWDADGSRIYLEGRSPAETWEPDGPYIEEFTDPMWRRWGAEAEKADGHHGGMDYIMLKAVEEDLTGGTPYPAGLDDLALWTSVTPLSCRSIAEGGTVTPR